MTVCSAAVVAPRGFGAATLCRPDSKNEKTRLKLSLIEALKNGKKALRPVGHRSVELGFGFCFQQNAYGGVGLWLRDAGRGPWRAKRAYRRNRRDRRHRRNRKSKTSPRIHTDDTDRKKPGKTE